MGVVKFPLNFRPPPLYNAASAPDRGPQTLRRELSDFGHLRPSKWTESSKQATKKINPFLQLLREAHSLLVLGQTFLFLIIKKKNFNARVRYKNINN